jgi:replication factor A2
VQDGDFVIHNIELNQVSFVGVIRNVVDNTSNLQVQIEDGTGSLEIRKWSDENAPADSVSMLVPNKYVYVTGSVKEFSGKKNIQHATFREITDYNEVIYHQLSAIDTYFEAKGLFKGREKTQSKEGLFVSNPSASESKGTVSDRIFEFVQENTPSMPEGVPAQLVAQSLGLLVDDVVLHCGKLTEDGKIYVGYDEHGYLAI